MGMAGVATFSKEWESKWKISGEDERIYLWAYQMGKNDWIGGGEGGSNLLEQIATSPDNIHGKRLPGLIAWPSCNPFQGMDAYADYDPIQGMDADYDPKVGFWLMK
jgi:hypothetical protein